MYVLYLLEEISPLYTRIFNFVSIALRISIPRKGLDMGYVNLYSQILNFLNQFNFNLEGRIRLELS